jgi:hypothetical protein
VNIRGTLDTLVADLKAAGLTGSHYDPELVNPPAAAWVERRSIRDLTLGGGGTVQVYVYLLAVTDDDDGEDVVIGKLDDALAGVLPILTLSDDDDAPVNLNAPVLLPGYATPLPAYRLAVDLDLES